MKITMNQNVEQDDDMNENLDETVLNDVPVITTSSPSTTDSGSELLAFGDTISKLSSDHNSDNDEFDTSFINNNNNNNQNYRRPSFLRSPTANNLNSSNTSRGNVRRWSQSLSNAAKSRQQKTIHFMPSRLQRLPTTLSLDGHRTGDTEIEHFVREIMKHNYLMELSTAGQQLRMNTLRSLPQTLSVKRRIKSRVNDIVNNESQRIGMNRWKRASYFIGFCSNKMRRFIRNGMRNVRLWYDSLKEIEGYFGAGVETYFRFFQFLFIINFLIMFITFMFIVVPQVLNDNFKDNNSSYSKSRIVNGSESFNHKMNIFDFFTGEGWLENSKLFYGSYTTRPITLFGLGTYSLPYAYLITMICLYTASIVVFSITTAESYRKSFIATSGGEALKAHKLFCSWDFGISNKRSANMKCDSIYFELRTILNELYDSEYQMSIWQKVGCYVISVAIWIFTIVVLIGTGYSIVYGNILDGYEERFFEYFPLAPLCMPSLIVMLMVLIQTMFEWLGSLEDYKSPRSQLHIALIRNYLLLITIITALIVKWLSGTDSKECWETSIGQKVYRLIIIDFLFVTLFGSVLRCIRFIIYRFVWKPIGISEFNISHGCLGLILNQTLLWIGLFFSPLLAAVIILKMIATFYLKKIVLIRFCKSPSKLWRSSQTFTLFLAMTFVSLTICIAALLFVLTQIKVSQTCGPLHTHGYMFEVLRADILKLQENHILYQLFILLTRPASIGCVLLTLCVLVYYLRSKSKARIAMVKLLKDMLFIEAKDKEFLLANITRVTQENDWLMDDLIKQQNLLNRYGCRIDRSSDGNLSSHTNKEYSFKSSNCSSSSSHRQFPNRSLSSIGLTTINSNKTNSMINRKASEIDSI